MKILILLLLSYSTLHAQELKDLKQYFSDLKKKNKDTIFIQKVERGKKKPKVVTLNFALQESKKSVVTEGNDLTVRPLYNSKAVRELAFPRPVDKYLKEIKSNTLGEVNFRVSEDEINVNYIESYLNTGEMRRFGTNAAKIRLNCLGTSLIKITYDLAKAFNITKIVLMSAEEAMPFYEKIGFKSIDKRPGFEGTMQLNVISPSGDKDIIAQLNKCK